jgi:hypothetical protein
MSASEAVLPAGASAANRGVLSKSAGAYGTPFHAALLGAVNNPFRATAKTRLTAELFHRGSSSSRPNGVVAPVAGMPRQPPKGKLSNAAAARKASNWGRG